MRILYVGELNTGATCVMRRTAFQDLGHQVTSVDTCPAGEVRGIRWFYLAVAFRLGRPRDTTGANAAILRACRQAEPFDLLWIDKGLTIHPSTIAQARRLHPDMLVAGYSPDDMANPGNQSAYFRNSLSLYDLYFTTKTFGVAELHAMGAPRVEFNGNAYFPPVHRPIELSDEDRRAFDADVGFIGTYEPQRYGSMLHLARNGVPLRVFGGGWPDVPDAPACFQLIKRHVYNDDYAKAICGASINLCFLRKANRDRQTQRSVEIPACGAFMLAERTDEHQALFEEGKEADFFSDDNELLEKVRYYLKHPELRQRIAHAGRQRCLDGGYSYQERLRGALNQLQVLRTARAAGVTATTTATRS